MRGAIAGALLVSLSAPVAKAQAPPAADDSRPEEATAAAEPPANRWEPGLLPAINFDSDLGFGFGAVATATRFEPSFNPFRLRLEAQLFMSAKTDADDDVTIPFHDHFVRVDLPGLWDRKLRLQLALAFGRLTNTGYYGLGNDSARVSDAELQARALPRSFHQYGRTFPRARATARFRLLELPARRGKRRLELLTGLSGAYNWVSVLPQSALAADMDLAANGTSDGQTLAELLHGTSDHALLLGKLGLLWDSRDHEFAPSRGNFSELSLRLSPGVDEQLHYLGAFAETRWFAPLWAPHLVIASRIAGDVIVGDAPLYQLAEYGVLDIDAGPGGSSSVRGVLLRRYHGKLKLIGNLELRGRFPRFTIGEERIRLGLVGFVDAGRVWADWRSTVIGGRDVDGPYSPFKLGVGGGLRGQWGEAFVLRADLAYSPSDESDGFYIDLGHVF